MKKIGKVITKGFKKDEVTFVNEILKKDDSVDNIRLTGKRDGS